jgi:hypothetical protein
MGDQGGAKNALGRSLRKTTSSGCGAKASWISQSSATIGIFVRRVDATRFGLNWVVMQKIGTPAARQPAISRCVGAIAS